MATTRLRPTIKPWACRFPYPHVASYCISWRTRGLRTRPCLRFFLPPTAAAFNMAAILHFSRPLAILPSSFDLPSSGDNFRRCPLKKAPFLLLFYPYVRAKAAWPLFVCFVAAGRHACHVLRSSRFRCSGRGAGACGDASVRYARYSAGAHELASSSSAYPRWRPTTLVAIPT